MDFKTDLTQSDWTVIQSGISGVEPMTELNIEVQPGQLTGFYRIRVVEE